MPEIAAELPLKLPAPAVSVAEIEALVKILAGVKLDDESLGWMTAKEIAARMGMRPGDGAERKVRKIANSACPAVVSFPGSSGYKLWQLCTVKEVTHCIDSFESQGRDMIKRAVLYRQAYHRRFRGAPAG